jgi:hypothetical protein
VNRAQQSGWSGLAVVVIFLTVATVMAATVGFALLFPGHLLDAMWRLNPEARTAFESMGRLSSLLLFVVGAVAAGTAVGILQRRKLGWWLAVLLFSVNAIGDAVSVIQGRIWQGLSGVLISALFLTYLLRPSVRVQFNRPSGRS